jgi:hypothetical protein
MSEQMSKQNEVELREEEIRATREGKAVLFQNPEGPPIIKQKENWFPKKTTSSTTGQMTLETS